ncbi:MULTISPECIES: [protein-PII] uridylyltransferase [unclassified Shewanella]|uniref:[protein-PII] uridylyltransferase n=1 Tax=unclassified Shewanella TaxID=196818 RepID=UPI000C85991E|nr:MULTISPECIES: [protein-PII] uridylyltransferase [unclassified Shewanella]MDO6638865.1 [protein-PII] uridylyltransferase [Shewanella sp. 5_MG-2023]PMH86508.1 [protein-PII] uridylyltransferase [Shewanella sp. 10N.286.48.B5]PMI03039.1 [protein-PII] uridylyltransferase [Shewanella sp. 10N.286.48.A6]
MFLQPVYPILQPNMSIVELKQAITDFDIWLEQQISCSPITEILTFRAQFFDKLLSHIWQKFTFDTKEISLNAVGGYGRQTLHPFSDIDICIIHDHNLSTDDANKLSDFLTQLWDLGLDLGHAVRRLDDTFVACKEDVTIATTLLEIRNICGHENHQHQVISKLYGESIWSSAAFFEAKFNEQQVRHHKAQGTAFNIEPNLKNSPGGMRDIQTITWIARKHFSIDDLKDLRRLNFLTADEYAELMECQNFIWRVRFSLHQASNRSENRLLLQHQAEVARLLGFGDSGNITIEKMMRQLFRAMKRIRELNLMLMAYFQREISPLKHNNCIDINDNFEILNGQINAKNQDVFIDRPQIMWMFYYIAEYHQQVKGITPETLRLIRQVRRRLMGDLQDFHVCRELFVKLFKHPQGMGLAITLMHQHGILTSYLPQWREVVGQMQFDLFHAYTVDEHTHKLLKNLYALTHDDISHDHKLAADIYARFQAKETILFAALFHDLAKGRGGDHSELGAVDAKLFAKFHGLKNSQQQLISWLVEQHLLMSITSQRMDIQDPDVITAFAKSVGSLTKLDALYCLTVADIQATNDDLWNDWKASLLTDLYFATRKALRNGLENVLQLRSVVREHKQEALNIINADSQLTDEHQIQAQSAAIQKLWKNLPLSFFGNAESSEIAKYTLGILSHQQQAQADSESLIIVDDSNVKGCSDVFVYTKDRAGLFISLFNTLSTLKISVKQAQISQTKDGYVVEAFKVLDFDGKPIFSAQRRKQVTSKLRQVIDNNVMPPKKRPLRHTQSFDNKPTIEFIHSKKANRTLVHILALETHEFMGQIASAFRALELTIHSAAISTVGERADNVFTLSNQYGAQLSEEEQTDLQEKLVKSITSTL